LGAGRRKALGGVGEGDDALSDSIEKELMKKNADGDEKEKEKKKVCYSCFSF
jgi:hypothetical protein